MDLYRLIGDKIIASRSKFSKIEKEVVICFKFA